MPCTSPTKGWRSRTANANGRRPIVFDAKQGYSDRPVTVPCGGCLGCRLDRSRDWAVRITHEASMYDGNSFLSLTYDSEHIPGNSPGDDREFATLDVRDFQKFMKRMRKKYQKRIRFFHCGEYGSKKFRPHYHAIIFNHWFEDLEFWKYNHQGDPLFISAELQELWPLGFSSVGAVTFQSAAYCSRYILKKVTGEQAITHYSDVVDPDTGVVSTRRPEYTTMSRRPGIAGDWIRKYWSDVFPKDFVTIEGRKFPIPRFYSNYFETIDPVELQRVKAKRITRARDQAWNSTPDRLKVREKVTAAKVKQLKRGIEG